MSKYRTPVKKVVIGVTKLFFTSLWLCTSSWCFGKGLVIYNDHIVTNYVNTIVANIVQSNFKTKKKYSVLVINDKGLNAFVTASQTIFINRGLIAFLNSEAELAAVLAHELAHIRDNHIVKHQNKLNNNQFLRDITYLATGFGEISQIVQLYGEINYSGFGRKLELRADKLAASYLYKAQYDPQQLINVLQQLKDAQQFLKEFKLSRSINNYHGLFASHPRTDVRLQKVVKQAGRIPPGEDYIGRKRFRQYTTELVFGEDYRSQAKEHLGSSFTVWVSPRYRVKLIYPTTFQQSRDGDSMTFTESASNQKVILAPSDSTGSNCYASRVATAKNNSEELSKLGDHTYSFIEVQPTYVYACVIVGRYQFELRGYNTVQNTLGAAQQAQLVAILQSFKRALRQDFKIASQQKLYYHRAQPGDTFKGLSKKTTLGRHATQYLRVLNQYPEGEPDPGEWIKLVQ